jgi:hypothetical protein
MVNESAKARSASSCQAFRPRLRAFSHDKENPPKSCPGGSHRRENGTFLDRNKAIETLEPEYAANPRRKGDTDDTKRDIRRSCTFPGFGAAGNASAVGA